MPTQQSTIIVCALLGTSTNFERGYAYGLERCETKQEWKSTDHLKPPHAVQWREVNSTESGLASHSTPLHTTLPCSP